MAAPTRRIRALHAIQFAGQATGGFGPEALMTSGSHSTYHSLQTSVTKNSARAGLGLQASYTYSKSIDDTSAVLGGLFGAPGQFCRPCRRIRGIHRRKRVRPRST